MSDYGGFNELIKDLISGKGYKDETKESVIFPVKDVNEDVIKGFKEQRKDFWKYLLSYMKQKGSIKQEDLNENGDTQGDNASLFGYINEKADLDRINDFWSNLLQSYKPFDLDQNTVSGKKEDDMNYYWNESLSKIISYFLINFDLETMKERELLDLVSNNVITQEDLDNYINGTLDWNSAAGNLINLYKKGLYDFDKDGIKFFNGIKVLPDEKGIYHFHISDIINADAGLDFAGAPWVRPQYNVDGDLYKNVRGIDKIESVLNSSKELQYTVSQNQDPHWLRLLMPKYLRYVEVEDLNRNFWVIGQTIAAISAFLFGPDAPIDEMLKNLLNEIAQLWQNIMYLWAAAMLLYQEDVITNVHMEVVVLPNSDTQPYIKFDNFANDIPESLAGGIDWEEIIKRTGYVVSQYSTSNVVIIPCIRNNNYKHNYYSEEIYPGIIFYDRNSEKYSRIEFNDLIRVNVETFEDRIYAIREREDEYDYFYPYNADVITQDGGKYYGLLRTITNCNPEYYFSVEKNRWQFSFSYFNLQIYDRVYELIKSDLKKNQSFDGLVGSYNIEYCEISNDEILYAAPALEKKIDAPVESEKILEKQTMEITKGFYQGELISWWNDVVATKYTIKVSAISQIPIHYFDQTYVNNFESYNIIIKNIKKNSKNGDVEANNFISFLSGTLEKNGKKYSAAITALQYIYNLEKGYYYNEDGSKTNNLYSEDGLRNYLKDVAEASTENLTENCIKWIENKDVTKYLPYHDNYDEDIMTNKDMLYLSAIYLSFLTMRNINLDPDKYTEFDYIAGAGINASDYDKKALELYSQQYIKETMGSSIATGQFILLETSRSQFPISDFGSARQALILVDENGKVVVDDIEKAASANIFIIFGHYPQGDQRYSASMTYPDGITTKMYPLHYEYYQGSGELFESGLVYTDNEKVELEGNTQAVNTIQQNIIMARKGETLSNDNWCAVTIKTQYINNAKFYFSGTENERTYSEKYSINGNKGSIVTTKIPIEQGMDYDVKQKNDQKNLSIAYDNNEDDDGMIWTGKYNGVNYFIRNPLATQSIISVYRHDGAYAQRICLRNCDYSSKNYLKWELPENSDICAGGVSFENIRDEYEVIGNDQLYSNWEKYRSNGKYIPGTKDINKNFPLDNTEIEDRDAIIYDPNDLLKVYQE